jgi:hypothetical protein
MPRDDKPIIHGVTADNKILPIQIDEDGKLLIEGGGGGVITKDDVKSAIESAENLTDVTNKLDYLTSVNTFTLLSSTVLTNFNSGDIVLTLDKTFTTNSSYLVKFEIDALNIQNPNFEIIQSPQTGDELYSAKAYSFSNGGFVDSIFERGYYIVFSSLPITKFFAVITDSFIGLNFIKVYEITDKVVKDIIGVDSYLFLSGIRDDAARINTKFLNDFGSATDAVANTDTGQNSFIKLFKRLLSIKLPDAINGKIPVDASVLPVFSTAASANITTLLFVEDISRFEFASLEIVGTFSASIFVQARAFSSGTIHPISVVKHTGEVVSLITEPGIYYIPKGFDFVRIGPAIYNSGTILGRLTKYPFGSPPISLLSNAGSDLFSNNSIAVTSTAAIIRDKQPTRRKLIISASKNNTTTCYFSFGTATGLSATAYAFALEPGDVYIDNVNVSTAAIAAFSSAASVVSINDWV